MQRANTHGPDSWRELFEHCKARADSVTPGLSDLIAAELQRIRPLASDLPRGVIHADLFPDNMFFLKGEVSGLIDFYFACTDMLAYDIAIMLNAWCFEADVNFTSPRRKPCSRAISRCAPCSQMRLTPCRFWRVVRQCGFDDAAARLVGKTGGCAGSTQKSGRLSAPPAV